MRGAKFINIPEPNMNNEQIDHYLTTSLPDQIRENILIDQYNMTSNYPYKINVGVHIRRGDIYYRSIDDPKYRDKYYKGTFKEEQDVNYQRRFINLQTFINIMTMINKIYGGDNVLFHIFSIGEDDEFSDLACIENKILYISPPDHQERYTNEDNGVEPICRLISTMIQSDLLICSKSNLSFGCALLTRSKVLFPKWLYRS